MPDNGFVDLRLNREGDDHNESFWPSFTDIMTVIVMIFLLAMIILLLKNTELVSKLQLTLEAERQATAQALEIGKAKEALEKRLDETETILATLQQQVSELTLLSDSRQQQITKLESENSALVRARDGLQTRLETTRDELDKTTGELKASRAQLEQQTIAAEEFRKQLAATQQEKEQIESGKRQLEDELQQRSIRITALEEQQQKALLLEQQLRARLSTTNDLLAEARALATEKDAVLQEQQQTIETISDERSQLERQTQRLNSQIETLSASVRELQESLAGKVSELSSATARLTTLEGDYAKQQQEIEQVRQRYTTSQQNFSELEGEYDDLKQKYDKLFKPARTSNNKYIVELRYTSRNGTDAFLTKRPEESDFRLLSVDEAEALLAETSRTHCDDLYVRIIFPEGETLSHSKAWSLTKRLHQYDYYFRTEECP